MVGMVAGLAHYFTLMYWIVVVLGHYGGLPLPASIGVLVLFCLYLALYPSLFAMLAAELDGRRFQIFGLGALWVGTELLRAKALTGFPWSLLGHSQFDQLRLIQVSDLVGAYGISFLIVASNALLFLLIFKTKTFSSRLRKAEAAAVGIMFAAAVAYGTSRLNEYGEKGNPRKSVKVAVVQGNIDQSVKWNPDYQRKTIQIYEELTDRAASFNPDLVVWPETAVPFFYQEQNELSKKVVQIAVEEGTALIFGSPAYGVTREGPRYYNRAYAISKDGKVTGFYDKMHLVPFGEYVPLKGLLFFVDRLVPAAGDFASGEILKPLQSGDLTAGILICFEVLFPELSRGQVRMGADVLVNLTNDAWFGRTSAPYQHLSMAVFRAVENRIPVVRAANTGISAFIDPTGEITTRSAIFERDVLVAEVGVSPSPIGFYTRHGDLFAFFLTAFSAIQIVFIMWYKRDKTATKTRRHKETT